MERTPCTVGRAAQTRHTRALAGLLDVIIVTHNLAQAKRIADDVAVFWIRDGAGTVIEAGPADAVFGAPRSATAAAYIGGARG